MPIASSPIGNSLSYMVGLTLFASLPVRSGAVRRAVFVGVWTRRVLLFRCLSVFWLGILLLSALFPDWFSDVAENDMGWSVRFSVCPFYL